MSDSISFEGDTSIGAWDVVDSNVLDQATNACNKVISTALATLQHISQSSAKLFYQFQRRLENTPLLPIVIKTNTASTEIEKIFNIAGCVPGLGMISGTVRSFMGKVQTIAGLALLAISEVGKYFAIRNGDDGTMSEKWEAIARLGMEHTLHGCLNVLRGYAEVTIGNYTMGIGNVVFLAPNLINNRNFLPYFNYGTLTIAAAD